MDKENIKWKGQDISLMESIDEYGMVYQYDGEDFNGYIVDGYDENGIPSSFAPFWMDNQVIDDYFKDDGDAIARMCGTSQDEMDYEWKMDALMAYYGTSEFTSAMYYPISRDELIAKVSDNWFGKCD